MTKWALARWVSIVGHPFALALLLGLTPMWSGGQAVRALRVSGVILMVAVVPMIVFVRRRRASGDWETVDASHPSNRPALFRAIFIVVVVLGLYFGLVERSVTLLRGTVAVAILAGIAAILNRWIKLSLHLAFATFTAVALYPLGVGHWLPVALFLPLLAWSRLVMGRHTMPEIIAGFGLGAGVGAAIIW